MHLCTTIEHWPIDRLIPYARNARTHSAEQVAQVAASIREFGFTNPILVDTGFSTSRKACSRAPAPSRDLYSGVYGGASPNAIFGLIELLGTVKDKKGKIKVKGFYDDVEDPLKAELESWARLPFSEAEFLRDEVGSKKLTGEKDRTVLERVWSRPTFEVHGIAGGFTGAGSKTVIPSKAMAKVSFRLVPNQDPDKIVAAFRKHVEKYTPKGIHVEVRVLGVGPGLMVNTDHPAIQVAASAMEDIFGKPTVFTRSGGSIPIVGDFKKHLGIPTILMGFGLPDDGLHSPNEKFSVENYYKGIRTVAHFFEKYGVTAV